MGYRINIDGTNEQLILTIGSRLKTALRAFDEKTCGVFDIMNERLRDELVESWRTKNRSRKRGQGKILFGDELISAHRIVQRDIEKRKNDVSIMINGLNSLLLFETEVSNREIRNLITEYSTLHFNINFIILPSDKDIKLEISDKIDRMCFAPSYLADKLGNFYLNLHMRTGNHFTIFIKESVPSRIEECTPNKRAELIFKIVQEIIRTNETLKYNSRLRNVKLNTFFQDIVNKENINGLEFIYGHTRKIIKMEE